MRITGVVVCAAMCACLLPAVQLVLAQELQPFPSETAGISTSDPSLQIDSLISLANSHVEEGTHWRALEAYSEAADISRRSEGLFNDTLISLLGLMADIAAAGGDIVLAGQYQLEAHEAAWRQREQEIRDIADSHGTDSTEYIVARLELAQWLLMQRPIVTESKRGNRRFRSWSWEAQDIYDEVIRQIEKDLDEDPTLMVMALRARAGAGNGPLGPGARYGYSGVPGALLDARKFLERLDEPEPELHASILVDIGDRRLASRPDEAYEDFAEAWRVLGNVANVEELRLEYFAQPQLLSLSYPLLPAGLQSDSPDAINASAELEFVVHETGRVSGIRVVSAEPEWAGDVAYASIATSLFRPQLVDGKVVAAAGSYTWTMRYDPETAALVGLTAD